MTVQLTHGPARDLFHEPVRILSVVLIASALGRLRDRLRRVADLRAARKRRRLPLYLLDDRLYADLAQARAKLDFTYRNNLDLR